MKVRLKFSKFAAIGLWIKDNPELLFEPMWLKRTMVDPLPASSIEMMNARLIELRQLELEAFEKEQKRVRIVARNKDERVSFLFLRIFAVVR